MSGVDDIMRKAMLSKKDLGGFDPIAIEYMSCVGDIIEHNKIEKLAGHFQHCNTCRLQHSINVSYYSFIICRKFGWNKEAAARAGLMHDLYYYDWRVKNNFRTKHHAKWHPLVAKDNARKICDLHPIEEDAIVKHMWPMTLVPPRFKESYVVCLIDKFCAVVEYSNGRYLKIRNRFFKKAYQI